MPWADWIVSRSSTYCFGIKSAGRIGRVGFRLRRFQEELDELKVLSKICGITRLDDAHAVVRAGADAMGLNFVEQSPRHVSLSTAGDLADAVAGRLTRVGLFFNAPAACVEHTLSRVDLDVLQFHGDESAEYCRSFRLPYMKAIRVAGTLNIEALEAEYHDACCLLLDTFVPGQPGGTGQSFDWSLWPENANIPLVLAGGLTPANVAEAIARTQPYGVDVSGGVESGQIGQKDPEKVMKFVWEVGSAGIQ